MNRLTVVMILVFSVLLYGCGCISGGRSSIHWAERDEAVVQEILRRADEIWNSTDQFSVHEETISKEWLGATLVVQHSYPRPLIWNRKERKQFLRLYVKEGGDTWFVVARYLRPEVRVKWDKRVKACFP